MKKGVKILFIILILIFVGVFIYSAINVIKPLIGYKEARDAYDDLTGQVVQSSSGKSGKKEQKEEEAKEEEIVLDPEICPIEVDFDALYEQCGDIVGWLYCPDTVINYPVVQCDDNMFYLHRLINGNYNASGSLFVECQCVPGFKSGNDIIYGHHMNDGSMFAKLVDYTYQSYYDEHPVMYLLTPKYNYRIELFAGFVTNMESDIYTIDFVDDDVQQAWIENAIAQSTFESNVDVKGGDKLLTLSTCTYDYDNARYVVIGKMVAIH